jgi:hypothetical protein
MHFHPGLARRARAILLPPILFALAVAPPVWARSDRDRTGPARPAAVCVDSPNSVQQLAKIFNTRDRNFDCLGVTLDGTAFKALRVESHRFVKRADASVADNIEIAEYSVAQIESRHGAVLDGAQGHDAVIVQGRVSAADGDVELITSYLYDGLTGEYRSCRIKLDRRADTAPPAWRMVNQYNETVSRIVVRTRTLPVLGTIGIANLEGACTPTRS